MVLMFFLLSSVLQNLLCLFCIQRDQKTVTLPCSPCCLETQNKYTISCLTDELGASIYVMLVRKILPRNCGAHCHLETDVY